MENLPSEHADESINPDSQSKLNEGQAPNSKQFNEKLFAVPPWESDGGINMKQGAVLSASHAQDHLAEKIQLQKGWKLHYKGAINSDLINRAKTFLVFHNYDLPQLLQQEMFQRYDQHPDYQKFVKKFLSNNVPADSKSKTANSISKVDRYHEPTPHNQQDQSHQESNTADSQTTREVHLSAPQSLDLGSTTIRQEILNLYLEDYLTKNQEERYMLLLDIGTRNTQTIINFLQMLSNPAYALSTIGIFGMVEQLVKSLDFLSSGDVARIIAQALVFYRGELIQLQDETIFAVMTLLAKVPNIKQAMGLARYVVFNDNVAFSKKEELLKDLDKANPGVIPLLYQTWASLKIDYEVIQLIPDTLFCLNYPFIQALKKNHGLALIRGIPAQYTGYFIQIAALSRPLSVQALDHYLNSTSMLFNKHQEKLVKGKFQYFMHQLSEKLQHRDARWIGKTVNITQLTQQIVLAQVEKETTVSEELINNCLEGDNSELILIAQQPKGIKDFSSEKIKKLLEVFEKLNPQINLPESIITSLTLSSCEVLPIIRSIEDQMKLKLHPPQSFCLNYVLETPQKSLFCQFGIGNGKTVLCTALAIVLAQQQQRPVFIVSANEYLVTRDMKLFERVISSLQIKTGLNQYSKQAGVYYYTKKQLEKLQNNVEFMSVWNSITVIVDEYDSILFTGPTSVIKSSINLFTKCQRIIGFTGSKLIHKEVECLKQAFSAEVITFPTLEQINASLVSQLPDVLISSTQYQYIQELTTLIKKQISYSPVLIVAGPSYSLIESALNSQRIDKHFLKSKSSSAVGALIEKRFIMKNSSDQYGVYVMSECQGRGTDIPTSETIEDNGGSMLIVADVFTSRSEEQCKGRIGRLNKKGQWLRFLYVNGTHDSAQQYIETKQAILQNEYDTKIASFIAELNQDQSRSVQYKVTDNSSPLQVVESPSVVISRLIASPRSTQKIQDNQFDQSGFITKSQSQQQIVQNAANAILQANNEVSEQSKLGFYQPSIIELIVDQMKERPQLRLTDPALIEKRLVESSLKQEQGEVQQRVCDQIQNKRESKLVLKRHNALTRITHSQKSAKVGKENQEKKNPRSELITEAETLVSARRSLRKRIVSE